MEPLSARVVRRTVLTTVLSIVCGLCTLHAQPSFETRLKAAVLSKFPQFVEWPPAALDGRTTIDICVLSPDPFGADLQALVAGETLNGRAIAVRHLASERDVAACHVLFVPAEAPPAARRAALQNAGAQPTLTVGDDRRFLDDGGMVQLRQVNGRLRFDVNVAAAQRSGLRISSQLLQLALSVRGRAS